MMRCSGIARAFWSAIRSLARTCSGIADTIFTGAQKSLLFSATLTCALANSWTAYAGSNYLAVWSSDKETDDRPGVLNTDFLAIIDADPKSRTYGKVVNTASLDRVPGANLLNDIGLEPGDVTLTDFLGLTEKYGLPATGIPSDALNEAHHMTHDPIVVWPPQLSIPRRAHQRERLSLRRHRPAPHSNLSAGHLAQGREKLLRCR
jgi:hypothetical protein